MFSLMIPGAPRPQKQIQFNFTSGKKRAYDPSSKDKYNIATQAVLAWCKPPMCEPVALFTRFYLPIPKSTSLKKRAQMLDKEILPDKRPDLDNMAYLVCNALKKIVYDDDSRVCAQVMQKFYSDEPRTEIEVHPLREVSLLSYESKL